jgi:RNA polymerase sigma factor (sigma-70 family)
MQQHDAELVAAFQAGDERAFDAIYRCYAPLLTIYAWRRCTNWHLAEEMVQEAMLNAWKYIPHGRIHNLNGYLCLLVREIWWMRATQMRRRPETESFDPHARYQGQIGYVEDLACRRETIQEVITLLDCLPDDERDVAILRVLYGYDVPGTAKPLGRSVSNTRAAWKRCWRKFRAWAGTKEHYDALDQALILARYPEQPPTEQQCKVPGCARPRHAYERCQYHAEGMLARRRQRTEQRR